MKKEGKNTLLEVSQVLLLEDDLDFATSGDFDSFGGILTITRGQSCHPNDGGKRTRKEHTRHRSL